MIDWIIRLVYLGLFFGIVLECLRAAFTDFEPNYTKLIFWYLLMWSHQKRVAQGLSDNE